MLSQPRATWAGAASHLIGECFDAAKPFIEPECKALDPYVRFVSAQLFIDCHLTSESVLILVREAKDWDADLVARAVLEGTVKFVYMLLGAPDDRQKKAFEFWELMPDLQEGQRSERASRILADVPDPDSPNWRPFKDLVLSNEKIEILRHGLNKTQRQVLMQRWSFAGIAKHFTESDDSGLKLLANLAHGYGMSSHLLHKDGVGVGMVWERYQRDPARQEAVALGHAARVVSDVCAFSKLRLLQLIKSCASQVDCIRQIEDRYAWLEAELQKAGQHFTNVEYPGQSRAPEHNC